MKLRTRSRLRQLALLALLTPFCANAQSGLTISTTGSVITTNFGSSNLLVDNALTITGSTSISQATATISTGYQTGDVLSFDAASLPSGVTGSFNTTTGVLSFSGSSATPAAYQALLRTVKISLTSSSATARAVTFTLGSLASYTNGHYYKFVSTPDTWANAKTAAASVGNQYYGLTGYLATVTSSGENAFIKQVLGGDGWIGASDNYVYINAATGTSTYANQTAAESHWYWVTGPEAGTNFSNGNTSPVVVSGKYMNWNSSEPNNSSGSEDFGEIFSSGTGAWNDLPSTSTLGYVIEYGGLAGDPSVQLSASRTINVKATSIDGTYTYCATTYHPNGTAVVADGSLNIAAMSSITDARVTVATNFNSGDVLGYTGSLPSGVTSSYNSTTGVLSFSGSATAAQWQTLLRTVTFRATSNPNVNREVTFSLGSQVAYSNGHFYQYVSSANISWSSAKTAAAGLSYMGYTGYLATITSSGENTFITQKLAGDGWIGASDDYTMINAATGTSTYANQTASEGNWYWVTGPEAGTNFSTGNGSPVAVSGRYNNWSSGEPNNSGGENYGQIYASGSTGKWNDLNGTSQAGYVVEYGGLSNDPVVALSSTSLITVGSPLPIEQITLSATPQQHKVSLRWETINERHVSHFDVERSGDGSGFERIGNTMSLGSGNNSYTFADVSPLSDLSYYRIRAIDEDGSSYYSSVSQVRMQLEASGVTVSPNPANGAVTISRESEGACTITCRDAMGKTVFVQQAAGRLVKLDVSRLAPGIYSLSLDTNGGHEVLSFQKN